MEKKTTFLALVAAGAAAAVIAVRQLSVQSYKSSKEEEEQANEAQRESNSTTEKNTTSLKTAYRTHSCNELRKRHIGQKATLCGWVQKVKNKNLAFVELRDRFGRTQIFFENPGGEDGVDSSSLALVNYKAACSLGRESVIQVTGTVVEAPTADGRATDGIEVRAESLQVLNHSKTPPFLIQDETDAAEDTRMRYRYLDIRRNPIKDALLLRNKVTNIIRRELSESGFCEVETPILIKSTPEGARDFVVPSRTNPGRFYALPQSPQTFKQLLMVGGMDRYYQIVKCFRDEELRADRQPEFTQIDCEMSFVSQEDILNTFESLIRKIFYETKGVKLPPFQRMEYKDAMQHYGIDKPDLRFDMKLHDLTELIQNQKGTDKFPICKDAGIIVAIAVPTYGTLAKKKIKALEKQARTEAGAEAMVWLKVEKVGPNGHPEKLDSSAKKNYSTSELASWAVACNAGEGDLVCIFAGPGGHQANKTREICGKWRHIMGSELGYRDKGFNALWVVNFPLLEWSEDDGRFVAMHHPFTSCFPEDEPLMATNPGQVRANAYDMVINGVEVGGGSVRIHEREKQMKMFELLGFSQKEAEDQFGFLLGAFEYGTPPHGGLAFGLDRLCTILSEGAASSIRDVMAFPKNRDGRDVMIDSPSSISPAQLKELAITLVRSDHPE